MVTKFSMLMRFLRRVAGSWLFWLSAFLTGTAPILDALNIDFPGGIVSWVGIILMIFVFLSEALELEKKIAEFENPEIDFSITLGNVRVIHAKWFTSNQEFLEVGEFEFRATLEVQNRRLQPTVLKFAVVQIDTDCPVVSSDTYDIEVKKRNSPSDRQNKAILSLDGGGSVEADFKAKFQMELQPYQEKLPQVGKATSFKVVIRVTQTDKSSGSYELDLPDAANVFGEIIRNQVENWIQVGANASQRGVGAKQIVEYLELLWR